MKISFHQTRHRCRIYLQRRERGNSPDTYIDNDFLIDFLLFPEKKQKKIIINTFLRRARARGKREKGHDRHRMRERGSRKYDYYGFL
jgi:hypothetical protein